MDGLPLVRPPQQYQAGVASTCSRSHLLPSASLSGSSRLMPVLKDETEEPPASERDLDWETRDPGSGTGLVNTQLCDFGPHRPSLSLSLLVG